MFSRLLMILAIATLAIHLALFGEAALAQDSVQTDSQITAEETSETDARIDQRLEEIYDELEGLRGVFVTVRSGVVILRGRVAEPALADQAVELASRVDGVVAVRNEISQVTSIEERLVPVAERISNRFWQAVEFLPLLAVAALAGALVFLTGLWVAKRTWPWDRIAPNAFIADLLRQIARIAFFVGGLLLALDILGATALLGTILGAAGIVGLAIGFAVRDTVENYIASILLSLRQPFRPKDYIKIDGFEGNVIRLTSRATVLMDVSGNHIRIPNATVFKGNIINYSRNPQRRFDFVLGIGPENNADTSLALALAEIGELPFILNVPAPNGWIDAVGDSTINLFLSGWINQTETSFVKARSQAIQRVMVAFEDAGISMPVPTYRLEGAENAAEPPEKPKPPAKTKLKAKEAARLETVRDTGVDDTIEHKIDEERLADDSSDLLNNAAPTEL
ncbi:MAG: mechanosensitive ion channel family protein [Pseudomonadota bacterium]